jgi:hypothetical protein
MFIDANGVANSICVESTQIQEESGVYHCELSGWKAKGIYFHGSCQNYILDYVTVVGHASVNAGGIGIDLDCGAAIFRRLSHFTIVGDGTDFDIGVRIDNYVSGKIEDGNIETCRKGIQIGNTVGGNSLEVSNINGQALTETTVRILNLPVSGLEFTNIQGNGGTPAGIIDSRNSLTHVAPVPSYRVGNAGYPRTTITANEKGVLINGETFYGALGIGIGNNLPTAKLDILTTAPVPIRNAYIASGRSLTEYIGNVSTADGALTQVLTLTLSDNSVYLITAKVAARRTDAPNRDAAILAGLFFREAAGVATQVGATTVILAAGVYTIALAVSGNDVRVNVTGIAGHRVAWFAKIEVERVNG